MFEIIPTAACLLTAFILFVSILRRKLANFPPGPLSLPIIGGLYRLGTDPFEASLKLWKEFGPIVGIDFASFKSVIINDHKLIKSALSNPAVQGRPDNSAWRTKFRVLNDVVLGYGCSEGSVFQENSKFALKTLRKFGFGSKVMETAILKEAANICHFLEGHETKKLAVKSDDVFAPFTARITWSLLSHRKMPDDTTLAASIRAFEGIKKGHGSAAIASFLPFLIKLAPSLTGWDSFLKSHQEVDDIIQNSINVHRNDPCSVDHEMDFIDIYLEEIDQTTDLKSIFYGETGVFNLKAVIGDLIAGGVDTVAMTMTWTLVLLLNFPKMFKKLQNELDKIELTKDHPWITLDCRSKLPFLEAVIREALRLRPPVAWGIPHRTTEDTKIGKYKIPSGTTVYANYYAVGQDPTAWGDPEVFRPERFLNPNDQNEVLNNLPQFLSFSIGRRACPGRYVGLDELFLLLGNILRHFDIQLPPGPAPSFREHVPHIIMTPLSFQFFPVRRST